MATVAGSHALDFRIWSTREVDWVGIGGLIGVAVKVTDTSPGFAAPARIGTFTEADATPLANVTVWSTAPTLPPRPSELDHSLTSRLLLTRRSPEGCQCSKRQG